MLKEMIFLQFHGGSFGSLLNQWEQIGVFDYMLPFLLIFAIIYGILTKINLFGDSDNRTINAIISLAVGLMALQFNLVTNFFQTVLPKFGIALIVVLVFLVLIGLFADTQNKGLMNTLMWGSFAIAALIIIQSLEVFRFTGSFNKFLGVIPYSWIPWIVFVVFIAIVVASARKPSTEAHDSILARTLKGD